MKSFTYLFSLIFMFFAHAASAIPLTASDDSGFRGESVVSVLTDTDADNLYAIWLDILFDQHFLQFDGVLSNTLDIYMVDTTDAASGRVSAILSASNTITSGSTEVLQASFSILGSAPFPETLVETSVTFQCHDVGNNLGCDDYKFDPVTAKITVLRSTQIPLPATLWLLALGMTALAGVRLRR